jgi:hypothetical protein
MLACMDASQVKDFTNTRKGNDKINMVNDADAPLFAV